MLFSQSIIISFLISFLIINAPRNENITDFSEENSASHTLAY